MKYTNKMYLMMQRKAPSEQELKREVSDWISFLRILVVPEMYRFSEGKLEPFDLSKINQRIQTLTNKENFVIEIKGKTGESHLTIISDAIQERTLLNEESFLVNQKLVEDYCDTKMIHTGIYGYIRSLDEQMFHNVEAIEKRTFEDTAEIEQLPKQYNNKKEIVIDCNQMAGYDSFYKGLCFTSCWKMYYSDNYFSIIPKDIFLEIQRVHSVLELSETMIQVMLYKDPFKWAEPKNLKDQRFYRDQLGFDQFSWSNGVGILRAPYIEYVFSEGHIQTIQYQNEFLQPIEKRKATHFVTRNYDLLTHHTTVHRTKGTLNEKAFFPWIDSENHQMRACHIINPERAIDNGLSAYIFYIFQVFGVRKMTEEEEYIAVLQFYLPKEMIKNIPLEQLWEQLEDMNISKLEQKVYVTQFDLTQENQHLRVVFLDDEKLTRKNKRE